MSGLTPSETEVANLLCKGLIDREIADSRNTSLETARKQIKFVLAKADVSSRVQFITKAVSIKPPVL